ncbi:outer membrane beta-barrel protein [Arsukibacterium sp.]|uniref:outer membrane beta-barrel protein n=1 Tax=Arsukibacterium sp. TaxID=1977258 RepID=UPI00299E5E7F|nr:outer membrane beta-barrel protein [Arsukibacterium sp.]MDX1679039.1 outer membrane beta-barrel protein [Arsukibacterium sp.]
MLIKKVALVAALLSSVAVQADTAPSYRYLQGSVEHISQSGEESLSDTGFGAKAAWQFNNNWFIGAKWQRFSDSESYAENFNSEQLIVSLELTLDRYYLGGGYIMPISDVTNLSFAGYLGSYRLSADGRVQVFSNGQPTFTESYSESDSSESLKIETVLRSNINSKLELSGTAYYEYLNADLDNKSQYGLGVGAQYHFSENFALTSDLSYGKVLDENTTQLSVGARYNF